MNISATLGRAVVGLGCMARRTPPILLASLQITKHCTQRCRQCAIPDSAERDSAMRMDTFVELVNRLERAGTLIITISGGEPLLHPDLPEMLRFAATKKFLFVQVLSNLYLPDRIRDRALQALLETGTGVQVSFDGFGEVADRLRGADQVSARVTRAILELDRENRRRPRRIRTALNIVLSERNLHQAPEILEFAESTGWKANVDLYRCFAPRHKMDGSLSIADLDGLERAIDRARRSPAVVTPRVILDGYRPFLEGRQERRCPYLESSAVVPKVYCGPDGALSVCSDTPVGNLLTQSPAEIFRSAAWRDEIAALRRCPGCWNTCLTPYAIMLRPRSRGDLKALIQLVAPVVAAKH